MVKGMVDISVIVAVRNGAATLAQCISSVLSQTGCTAELIIVDAVSEDGTQDIVESYGNHIDAYLREVDGGIYDAWNKALAFAKGDWCSFIGSDDYFATSGSLASLLDIAASHESQPVLVTGKLILTGDGESRVLSNGSGDISDKIWRGDLRSHVGALHKMASLRKIGGFDGSLSIAGDLDAAMRLIQIGPAVGADVVVAVVRAGGVSMRARLARILLFERQSLLRRSQTLIASWWLAGLPLLRRFFLTACNRSVGALFGQRAALAVLRGLRALR